MLLISSGLGASVGVLSRWLDGGTGARHYLIVCAMLLLVKDTPTPSGRARRGVQCGVVRWKTRSWRCRRPTPVLEGAAREGAGSCSSADQGTFLTSTCPQPALHFTSTTHMRRHISWLRTVVPQTAGQRRCLSDARPFRAGDVVLLRQKLSRDAAPILSKPLEPGKRIESHRGTILHDDIIGKRVRDVVRSLTPRSGRDGTEYRIHTVTLDEYVRMARRLVTPIYPADANLIVNLLDLHPDEETYSSGEERLEILEAGTGHGGLTLHLSRAIHAANSLVRLTQDDGVDIESAKAQRRAVIHTIDVSPSFSAHAEKVIRGFRNGMYAKNVDFHVGDVSETLGKLRAARKDRDEPFLSHAFLDLPSADKHLHNVAAALRTDGMLIVFNPSITQINECAAKVKKEKIGLDLDKVVELGVNGGSGGREWDVRFVRPRATQKKSTPREQEQGLENESAEGEAEVLGDTNTDSTLRVPHSDADQDMSMVCRPKVGERIIGGGFLGIWKKHRAVKLETPSSATPEST